MAFPIVLLIASALTITEAGSVFEWKPYRNPPPFLPMMDSPFSPISSGLLSRMQTMSPHFKFQSILNNKDKSRVLSENSAENEIMKVSTREETEEHDQGNTIRIIRKPSFASNVDSNVPKLSSTRPSVIPPSEIPFSPIKIGKFSTPVGNMFSQSAMPTPKESVSITPAHEAKMELTTSVEVETPKVRLPESDFSKEIRNIFQLLAPPIFRQLSQRNAGVEIQAHHQKTGLSSKCDTVVCTAPEFEGDCRIEEVNVPLKETGSNFRDLTGCCPIHFCTHPDGSVETHFGLKRPAQQVQEKPRKTEEDDIARQMGFSSEDDSDENADIEITNGGAPEEKITGTRSEDKSKVPELKISPRAPILSPFDLFARLGLPVPSQLTDALKTGNAKIQGPVIITATFSSSDDPKNNPFKILEQHAASANNPSLFRPFFH